MAENTGIEWATHTFNCWRGCTKISPGCAHCYAETMSGRNPKTLGVWGQNGKRVVAAEAAWRLPLKWNIQSTSGIEAWRLHVELCKQSGISDPGAEWRRRAGPGESIPERHRVFCASLADVFEEWTGPMMNSQDRRLWVSDAEPGRWVCEPEGGLDALAPFEKDNVAAGLFRPLAMADVRSRLFRLIDDTPNLDWLLLTKRPENVTKMILEYHTRAGAQVCEVLPNVWLGTTVEDRQHGLPRIDILRFIPSAVRFLSIEPLLEDLGAIDLTGISWVIAGGESGHQARPMPPEAARSIRDQCLQAGVPFFFKQHGEWCAFKDLPAAVIAADDMESRPMQTIGSHSVHRFGKKAVGRLLDGREWNEMPARAGV